PLRELRARQARPHRSGAHPWAQVSQWSHSPPLAPASASTAAPTSGPAASARTASPFPWPASAGVERGRRSRSVGHRRPVMSPVAVCRRLPAMTDATATAAADVAPARQPDDSVELYFNGSRELPRRLIVIRTRYYLTVATYPLGTKRHRSFGYTSLAREDDR